MGLESQISLYLSEFSRFVLIENLALQLNKLGKGDTLAFLCILFIIIGYFKGKLLWIKSGSGGILILTLAGFIVQFLKHLIGRARPQMNLGDWHFIGPNLYKNGFDSFPSGHACASFALASFFSFYYPRWKILFYSIAFSISIIGRVILRHHFLSDVIVGASIGIAIGLFSARKLKKWVVTENETENSKEVEQDISVTAHSDQTADTGSFMNLKSLLAVIIFSSLILFTGLGKSALWDRDETEYAQSVIEMQQKNEWLIPTLEGQPFLEKPILMFWFVRISHLLFGVNEFSSRLPSAFFGTLTCVAAYFLGMSLWGRKTGLLSALILSSSFLFVGGYRLLLTDPFFVFFTVLSFVFYVYSFQKPDRKKLFLILSYAIMGLAVLSKGPIAFFPAIVFLIFEWITKKVSLKDFITKNFLLHLILLLIPIAIAAPWFVYSFSKEKQATETFFLYDNINRFLKGSEGHIGPMIYYIPVLLLGFFPWSFFSIPYFKKEWNERVLKNSPMKNGTLLLLIWITFVFVFFSFSAHKLPHYMLPLLPPLSCLIGKFWKDQILEKPVSVKLSFVVTIFLAILLVLVPIALYFWRPQYASLRLVIPFAVFLALLFWGYPFITKENWQVFGTIYISSFALFISFSMLSLPWIEKHRVTKPIGLAVKKYVDSKSELIGYRFSEPSLFIYGQRLFPSIEHIPLDTLLKTSKSVFVVVRETDLKTVSPQTPYTILERKEGFAENGGEMTLLLIKNGTPITTKLK